MHDYEIIVELSEAPQNRLRMTDLADRTAQSRSRLSHQINRMESKGLVVREGCGGDKRGTFAVLTRHERRTASARSPRTTCPASGSTSSTSSRRTASPSSPTRANQFSTGSGQAATAIREPPGQLRLGGRAKAKPARRVTLEPSRRFRRHSFGRPTENLPCGPESVGQVRENPVGHGALRAGLFGADADVPGPGIRSVGRTLVS